MNFWSTIHPDNWTRLSKSKKEKTDDLRRDILFSQILIIGLIISTLHFLNDLINANSTAFIIDAVFVVLLAVFCVLN